MIDPLPEPRNDEEIDRAIRMARLLWKACLFFPFAYLLIAWALNAAFFDGYGFWPLHQEKYLRLVGAFIAAAIGLQVAVFFIHRHFSRKMQQYRLRPRFLAVALWRRTLYGAMCGDTVSALGLILFLFNADWTTLTLFCLGSYGIYGQIAPYLPDDVGQRNMGNDV